MTIRITEYKIERVRDRKLRNWNAVNLNPNLPQGQTIP